MFDIIFGGKKKLNLTRELVEQRMRSSGFDDLESRLQVKNLSNLQLLGTPEAAIISIIEVTLKLQKKHLMLSQILPTIENHRKKLGSEPFRFNQILQTSQSPNVEQAGTAVLLYCNYRVDIENQGLPISDVQIAKIFFQASNALSGFNAYPPDVVDEILDALTKEDSTNPLSLGSGDATFFQAESAREDIEKRTGKSATHLTEEADDPSTEGDVIIEGHDNLTYFEKALEEIENNKKHKGVWAKVYARSSDDKQAEKAYIKMRAEHLTREEEERELDWYRNDFDCIQIGLQWAGHTVRKAYFFGGYKILQPSGAEVGLKNFSELQEYYDKYEGGSDTHENVNRIPPENYAQDKADFDSDSEDESRKQKAESESER